MGEVGVAIIVALIVLIVIVFFIAVEQGKTIAKYERELMSQAQAKKSIKVGKGK